MLIAMISKVHGRRETREWQEPDLTTSTKGKQVSVLLAAGSLFQVNNLTRLLL